MVSFGEDSFGELYILEINSLPSLGEHGSYVQGAAAVGLDFKALVNRLVDVASERYFGTSEAAALEPKSKGATDEAFDFLTSKRDSIERRIQDWARRSTRTSDPVGLRAGMQVLDKLMGDVGLRPVTELSQGTAASTWGAAEAASGGASSTCSTSGAFQLAS